MPPKYGAYINSFSIDGWTPLMQAVNYSHVEAVELLVKNGANLNVPHEDGQTALHLAFENIYNGGDFEKNKKL